MGKAREAQKTEVRHGESVLWRIRGQISDFRFQKLSLAKKKGTRDAVYETILKVE
jgi:hypothetical protein